MVDQFFKIKFLGYSPGKTTRYIYKCWACLGPSWKHIRGCLCKVHGIKEFFPRWQTTCSVYGHRRTSICGNAGQRGARLLAHPFRSSNKPIGRVSSEGHRVSANASSNVLHVSHRRNSKIQLKAKSPVFWALLPLGLTCWDELHRSDVYIFWTPLWWGSWCCP